MYIHILFCLAVTKKIVHLLRVSFENAATYARFHGTMMTAVSRLTSLYTHCIVMLSAARRIEDLLVATEHYRNNHHS